MARKTYKEKLLDVRWQKKRLEILQRDAWKCCICSKGEEDGVTLHVHHIFYDWWLDPWEYEPETLVSLCSDCHEKEPKQYEQRYEIAVQMITAAGLPSAHLGALVRMLFNLYQLPKHTALDVLNACSDLAKKTRKEMGIYQKFLDGEKDEQPAASEGVQS
jgi:hypothetical protein